MDSTTKQNDVKSTNKHSIPKIVAIVGSMILVLAMVVGSMVNPEFWQTEEQRGDALMEDGEFEEAAKTFVDPGRIGTAQYRDGQFEDSAKTFGRVPGADGAFNQGNAWLMNGKYELAIASYDRALDLRPDWLEANDNKSLALARKASLDTAADQRTDKGTEVGADEIVFDQKKKNSPDGEPEELSEGGAMSDAELQAIWMRQVKTTPGDFLRAKFAYQAATQGQSDPSQESKNTEEATE